MNGYLELYHHGIQGQKWGKKNGPPYPLSRSQMSSAEKKQRNIKKNIDKAARRTDKRKSQDVHSDLKSRVASNVKDKVIFEDYRKIQNKRQELYDSYEETKIKMEKEIDKNPKIQELFNKQVRWAADEGYEYFSKMTDFGEEIHDMAIDIYRNKERYLPETTKNLRNIKKSQGEYIKLVNDNVQRIVDEFGNEKISKLKRENITYNDIINQIVRRESNRDFYGDLEGRMFDDIRDTLYNNTNFLKQTYIEKYFDKDHRHLSHSAKGSTWEEHKYIKRVDGTYYYPDSYEGGRHLPDSSTDKEPEGDYTLEKSDIEKLANEVIRGNFGNGQTRKDLLGDNYQEVQTRVNEILRSQTGSVKISKTSEETKDVGEKAIKNAVEKVTQASKGLNMEQVYSVYRKKK